MLLQVMAIRSASHGAPTSSHAPRLSRTCRRTGTNTHTARKSTARRARLESGPPAPVHATAAVTTTTDPSITGPGRHAVTAEASQKPSKPNTNPGVTHRPNRCTRRSPAVNDVVDV